MIYELRQTEKAAALFEGWQETLIWSCLQGVMGRIYADDLENPASALALLGDFCFFGGEPKKEVAMYKPGQRFHKFMIMIPRNREWGDLIEDCYGKNVRKTVRYAIKKEPDIFDREKLREAVEGLPDGYTLKMIDEKLFWECRETEWCRDWTAQYDDYAMFKKYGLGVIIEKDGQPVSGASSYSGYNGGIEIEIDTREDYRRRGLAYICGAKLILECLKRGWYPSWDAHNRGSVALAEKLGYHFDYEYTVYEII
ncbi:MAG: GNAT family N-acetyltransferase [Dorea sp.]|jgi:GNAT superfamily N-acetyltransferase|nr:GNAT family N-acetyltransferase [Dorea sp.]